MLQQRWLEALRLRENLSSEAILEIAAAIDALSSTVPIPRTQTLDIANIHRVSDPASEKATNGNHVKGK